MPKVIQVRFLESIGSIGFTISQAKKMFLVLNYYFRRANFT